MAKKLTNTVKVVREGGMTDEQLITAMAVDPEHHVLRGVREILDRLDANYDDTFCNVSVPAATRADAGILKAAVRDVRLAIQDWNQVSKKKSDGQGS